MMASLLKIQLPRRVFQSLMKKKVSHEFTV